MAESLMEWSAGKTWYKTEGHGEPLVVIHGGPGYPHFYLEGLLALASSERQVIVYDQLGCGFSKANEGFEQWSVSLFVEELANLQAQLGLERMALLGHSWGASLAVEYSLAYPDRVSRLLLASPLFDSQLWVEEARRLQDAMPGGQLMQSHEQAGTTDGEEYQKLYAEFLLRHDCSMIPKPPELEASSAHFGLEVYNHMWGPSEIVVSGALKQWSCLDRLKGIGCPVLITSGSMDSATPRQVAAGAQLIQDMRWQLFPAATHSLHLEYPHQFLQTVGSFLSEAA